MNTNANPFPFLMKTNKRRTPKMGLQFSTLSVFDKNKEKEQRETEKQEQNPELYIHNEKLYTELKKKQKKDYIKKHKIKEPVKITYWCMDIFDEIELLYDQSKRYIIQQLKLREPVKKCKYSDEEDSNFIFL